MMKKVISILSGLILAFGSIWSQEGKWEGPIPEIAPLLAKAAAQFTDYDVVLQPDKDAPEYWAGAPSVVRDDDGTFWMACRMRSPEHPRGLRGYEIRILKSDDGIHFEKYHNIRREEVPIPGFERPALLIDPQTNHFKLYVCGPWQNGPWSIIKFDDTEDLKKIDYATARVVIRAPKPSYPRDVSVSEYKDPVIIHTQGKYHCYVIGYIRRNERIFHFESTDSEHWVPAGNINQPVMELDHWHNFFIRPSGILPLGVGYLFIYEGSSTQWYDPVYNIGIGLGYTFDLHNIIDLTRESPLAISSTPGNFHTFRYTHWMWVNGAIWVYAEVARPNDSHEIRLFRIKME
jgi:hypothetical protein